MSADGIVLTAGHCVNARETYTAHLPDGRKITGRPLGKESALDLGMIQLIDPPQDLAFVALGDSAGLAKGQPIFGVSHPGEPESDRGAVLRFGRVVTPRKRSGYIQSTVLMEPGDSGGPLFDIDGRLIGIHSQIEAALDDNEDVPVHLFRAYWDQLREGKRFSAATTALEQLGTQWVDTPHGIRLSVLQRSGLGCNSGAETRRPLGIATGRQHQTKPRTSSASCAVTSSVAPWRRSRSSCNAAPSK